MAPFLPYGIASGSVMRSVVLVAAVYIVTLVIMPRQGLWIVDNENRFLQAEALVENRFAEYAIPWSGRSLDPDFTTNPLRFNPEGSFQELKDNQLISVFQPAFIVISAVFYRALGSWGLYVLPLGAAILLLIGAARLAAALSSERTAQHLAVILTGLATPVWFYSQTFWEHTTAACLCVWGVVFALRFLASRSWRHLAVAFACLGAALFFRDVLGLFAVVLLGLLWLRVGDGRIRILLTAGVVLAASIALLVLFQGATTGRPWGFHAGTLMGEDSGLIGHLQDRPRLFYLFFCAAHPDRVLSVALAAPFLIAFLWRPRLDDSRFVRSVPIWSLAALATGGVFFVAFVTAPNALRHLLAANSFFFAAPLVILAFLRRKDGGEDSGAVRPTDFVLSVACLYFVAYCLVAPWAGAISLHWGARPIFVLYPLFTVLAATSLARWFSVAGTGRRWHGAVIGLLVILSVIAQVHAVNILGQKKAYSVRLARTAERFTQRIVITNVWWLGHEMYAVFFDKMIFYVQTQAQLESLEAAMRERGVDAFVFVSRPRPGPAPPPVQRLKDGGWDFYSLDFMVAQVSAGPD